MYVQKMYISSIGDVSVKDIINATFRAILIASTRKAKHNIWMELI